MQIRLDSVGVIERAMYLTLPELHLSVRRRTNEDWQPLTLYYTPDEGWEPTAESNAARYDDNDEWDEIYEWVDRRVQAVLLVVPIAEADTMRIYSHGLIKHALEAKESSDGL